MHYPIPKEELEERIERSYQRLLAPYYQIDEVYMPSDYEWYGDKEGRALLAFMSHYHISKKLNPCVEPLLALYPEKANRFLFLGPEAGETIIEEQLSGHSWLLRGLCEYYEVFKKPEILKIIASTVEHLYLPLYDRIDSYPVDREPDKTGGVSGNSVSVINHWKVSSDVGCAFMSLDGLSHAFLVLSSEKACADLAKKTRALLDRMIDKFDSIDKRAIKAQTHCSLTAARGMLRMLKATGDASYFEKAQRIFDLYVNYGMTDTYQNMNWWGRPDSWTEPCAIVDSLMVALELYKYSRLEAYRTLAARIYHNGFATAQRDNGGAGTESIVTENQSILHSTYYEAPFCCSMRFAEGLRYTWENADLLYAEVTGTLRKDEKGRYFNGDLLYTEILSPESCKEYEDASMALYADGKRLVPIPKYYRIPESISLSTQLQILF